MSSCTRREWLCAAGAAVGAAVQLGAGGQATRPGRQAVSFCLFSKHLPELAPAELGRAVKTAGFDGIDLTVRTKGHVAPEAAVEELPRAIDAIRKAGVSVPMITTELTSAAHPTARPLLLAAAQSGVRYFKTGYWRYSGADVRAQAAAAGEDLSGLASLARDCGIEMGFHNHAAYVGAALWDIAPAIDRLEPRWAGYYFDPRHAVAEGGGGAWKTATHLVLPRLKMIALKDCLWRKGPKGWQIENCPLGEGLVDWGWFASVLRETTFGGPVSLHLEYDIPAGTRHTIAAAERDLAFARRALA